MSMSDTNDEYEALNKGIISFYSLQLKSILNGNVFTSSIDLWTTN